MEYKIFESSDTNVKKFVFEWNKPKAIAESVLYRYEEYKKRTVICCSVQSGCPVGCTFCGTGKFFVRNLEAFEIVQQVDTVLSTIDCDTQDIEKFQIIFMSMGEPFLNYQNLKLAIMFLHNKYKNAQLLVSTSAPKIMFKYYDDFLMLAKSIDKIGLQFSVHESSDLNRKKLIPTDTCFLKEISTFGKIFAKYVERKPFFNYCVHQNNSSDEDVERLNQLFDKDIWEVTLSVICEKDESVHSSIQRQLDLIKSFNEKLINLGFSTRVFNPSGQDDIGGGCGQLWYFQEWLKNNK